MFSIIMGFGLSRESLFQSYMNKYIDSHNRATIISTVSMIRRLIAGLIYLVLGLLVKWSLTYTFVIFGIIIIVSSIISEVKEEHLID
jgi:hypothetical protein